MAHQHIQFFSPFLTKVHKTHINIKPLKEADLQEWLKSAPSLLQTLCEEQGFEGKSGQILLSKSDNGKTEGIIAGISNDVTYEDGSKIQDAIKTAFSLTMLKTTSFSFEDEDIGSDESERLHIGFGWANYAFQMYKKNKDHHNVGLILSNRVDVERVKSFVEAVCFVRDLVNIPANDMGPDELEVAAEILTDHHDIALNVIKDQELIKKNFPMIFDVGRGSTRRPRLLDFSWGNKKHPKLTLVGKGVCFDTGGLDIKPSQFMITMKKDMGGSAHVLGLAHLIMSLKLPVHLRVLIPAVENSISGDAYRPSDILQSRKGITVEVGNTDAEGRLVLADALTYACEETPDLLIDFATLTGAARVAVGLELPALFSNNGDTAYAIQQQSASIEVEDPVWNLPLWRPYRSDLDSSVADISSTGGKAGATTAALFLQEFIDNNIEWIHMDVFSWEQNGKTGRPKGGADTGMRAIFAFLEERFSE